jgi:hypothetical protein
MRCHNKSVFELSSERPFWTSPVVLTCFDRLGTCVSSVKDMFSIYLLSLVDQINCLAKVDGVYSYLFAIYKMILCECARNHGRLSFTDCLLTGVGVSSQK